MTNDTINLGTPCLSLVRCESAEAFLRRVGVPWYMTGLYDDLVRAARRSDELAHTGVSPIQHFVKSVGWGVEAFPILRAESA